MAAYSGVRALNIGRAMNEIEELIDENIDVSFRCKAAGGASGEFIVKTKTEILPPSDNETISEIKSKFGDYSKEVSEFYQKYGGISFHEQPECFVASLCIHPPEKWEELYEEMSEWLDMMDEDELDESGIDWSDNCVVFGEVPSSGNYFLMPLSGSASGKIIYQDHDGMEPEIYADSFNQFIIKFLSDPVGQIDHFGCYTRYSDGNTDKQWMPEEVIKS